MEFLIGILVFILLFFVLFNYVSISMTNTVKTANTEYTTNHNIFSINQNQNQNQYQSPYQTPTQTLNQTPLPVQSSPPKALNSKINLNSQTYDYNQYFFLPSPINNNIINPINKSYNYNYKQNMFV